MLFTMVYMVSQGSTWFTGSLQILYMLLQAFTGFLRSPDHIIVFTNFPWMLQDFKVSQVIYRFPMVPVRDTSQAFTVSTGSQVLAGNVVPFRCCDSGRTGTDLD